MQAVRAAAHQALIHTSRRPSESEQKAVGPEFAELAAIFDAAIDEEYLMSVAGKQKDLREVTFLHLKVDLNLQSLLDLPQFLPSLRSLVLDESVIASVRDLGVGLRCLISLSLNSCSLSDLDGIGVLVGLEDLCACDNFISDAAPLAMHDNIKTLNLSGNNISDISVTDALSSCPNLRSLFLNRNPVEKAPNFRLVIASLIPSLEKLDGSPVDSAAKNKVSNAMVLEAAFALHLADEDNDDEQRLDRELASAAASGALATSMTKSAEGVTASGMSSSSQASTYWGTIPDTGSELTHGSSVVLAGNVAAAMRRRRTESAVQGYNEANGDYSTVTTAAGAGGGGAGSRSVGGSGIASGGGNSTLEVLDLALAGESEGKGVHGVSSPFLGEGDVTATVMGQMFPASHNVAMSMITLGDDSTTSTTTRAPRRDSAHSPVPTGQRGSRQDRVAAASISFDAESREFSTDGGGVGGYLASISYRTSRPKSAVPSSMRGSWVGPSFLSTDIDAGGTGGSFNITSPRQHNGSRPQSAAAIRPTPSAPFKVEVAVVKDRAVSVFHDGNKAKASNKKGAPRVDVDVEYDRNSCFVDDEDEDAAPAQGLQRGGTSRFGISKSYIHKDLMLRGDDVYDVEGIAVTRAARQELMSASGRRAPVMTEPHFGGIPSRTVASMAGVSLGFDLQGSLAAIDHWVEEMDSDEDEDECEEEANEEEENDEINDEGAAIGSANVVDKLKNVNGNKKPSPSSSDADSFGRTNTSSRSGSAGSNRSSAGSRGFLSRDKIFSMCSAGLGITDHVGTPRSDDGVDDILLSAASKLHQSQPQPQPQPEKTVEPEPKKTIKINSCLPAALSIATAKVIETTVLEKMVVPETGGSPPRIDCEVTAPAGRGPANSISDVELIDLLRRPPKSVPQLRTKSSFCVFFEGMPIDRFKSIAERAFAITELGDPEACQAKVEKRLALVRDVLL